MRFQIITLIALIASASAAAVPDHNHGAIQSGHPRLTHSPKITDSQLKKLEDKANEIKHRLESALKAYESGASHHRQRRDTRGRKLLPEDLVRLAKTMGHRAPEIIQAVKSGKVKNISELESLVLAWDAQDRLKD